MGVHLDHAAMLRPEVVLSLYRLDRTCWLTSGVVSCEPGNVCAVIGRTTGCCPRGEVCAYIEECRDFGSAGCAEGGKGCWYIHCLVPRESELMADIKQSESRAVVYPGTAPVLAAAAGVECAEGINCAEN